MFPVCSGYSGSLDRCALGCRAYEETQVSEHVPRPTFVRQFGPIISVVVLLLVTTSFVSACVAEDMPPESSLSESVTDLKAKAATTPVRVIVEVQPEKPDGEAATQAAKAKLERIMYDAGAIQVDPIAGQPLLVMELTADQFDDLITSGLVVSIQEDKPEGLF